MKTQFLIVLLLFAIVFCIDGKKLSKSRSTSRGSSSRKTSSNPQPTSISQPSLSRAAQPSAPKPSLFGWQEQPAQAQRKSSQPRQSQPPKQPQTHSYPSSNTGLSGAPPAKSSYPSSNTGLSGASPAKHPSNQQESIQRSSVSQSASGQQSSPNIAQTNNQPSHSYPASNTGLSGSGNTGGGGYPQNPGLSGAGAPPPYSATGNNYHPQGPPPAYSNSGGYPNKQGPGAAPPYTGGNYGNNYHHPAPPPAHSPNYGGYGGHGGYGSYGYNPVHTPQMPGYFGNYGNRGYGGVGRSSNILTGVGIAGAGVGTILTGLALWNLARSTGQHRHTVIYDNRGQPVAVAPTNSTEPVVDPILGDLVNCTLTVSTDNATEVLGIPCAIATSFTPDADVKDTSIVNNPNDNTKCTVTVVSKAGREFMTTIPCSTLLNTAAENNVTEPTLTNNSTEIANDSLIGPDPNLSVPTVTTSVPTQFPLAGEINKPNITCNPEQGAVRDPINPCYSATSDLTVIPLQLNLTSTSPPSA